MEMGNKKHFILVHGACHGAWCWYKLAALLEKAGHMVTAVDLVASGIHRKQLDEVKSIHDYVLPLMEVMAMLHSDEKVVLVGHSFGGVGVSLAMGAFPDKISVAVFAAALILSPSAPSSEIAIEHSRRTTQGFYMDSTHQFDQGLDNPPTTVTFGPHFMASKMYQNCLQEDLKLATMLLRPARFFAEDFLNNRFMLTKEKFGSVSRVYIVCKEYEILEEDLQRWMADRASGCEIMEIEGSDHMVMLSKPHELLDCLLVVMEKHA